jgi:hypothetical protein
LVFPAASVKLIDDADNAAGSGKECVYTDAVTVPPGCVLDLDGLHLYTHIANVAGTVVNGTIDAVPVLRTESPLPVAVVGQFYQVALVAEGGVQPYSWKVLSGSLPAGLALDPSSGAISGTATVHGSNSFTVQVTDTGGKSATKEYVLACKSSYQAWREKHFTPAELADPSISGDLADPDHDLAENLLEYACNLNPKLGDAARLTAGGSETAGVPLVSLVPAPGGGTRLQVEFLRRKADSLPEIVMAARFTSQLATWPDGGHEESVRSIDPLWERVIVADDPPADATLRFGCVMVTKIP